MRVLDLFSGIGGFSLGLERAGMETVAFCEIEPFCQKVLAKHWPDVPIYDDITKLTAEKLENDGITEISVLTGGIPCQPFSNAGHKKGANDDRHLWPSMLSVIIDVRPDWVICENVTGIVGMELDNIISDLERNGYAAWTFIIPACAVGAWHNRPRVWVIANTNGSGSQGSCQEQVLRKHNIPIQPARGFKEWGGRSTLAESRFFRRTDGLPGGMDVSKRIIAIGNAVVPQIPEIIGRAIMGSL